MKVLVVGSGGREHALVWRLLQDAEVFAAPGNPGIAEIAECFPIAPDDASGIADLCSRLSIDLVVVGPEAPLIDGLATCLRASGIRVFGPDTGAAQLEGSKAFSKDLMASAGVPTARFGSFNHLFPALAFARQLFEEGGGAVVKASGAALGKGVVVCESAEEADDALRSMLEERTFGSAGSLVVVEERLVGREFSLLTLCSEAGYRSLPVAQDYKRIFDGDRGPNTGGMGSYSPVGWIDDSLVRKTEERVVEPMLAELSKRGLPFRGVLFSGIMVMGGEPLCLEYNVRFGDPETQSVMPRLGAGFLEALVACADGQPVPEISVLAQSAVTVVVAAKGYPGTVSKGAEITIGAMPAGVQVFHAGTFLSDGRLVASGGRVLGVTATAGKVEEARRLAYEGIAQVAFEGMQFRRDIAAPDPTLP